MSVYEGNAGKGSVVKISGRLDNGPYIVLWEGPKDESKWAENRIFTPKLCPCNQRVNIIRMDVELMADGRWYSPQAIQLIGDSTPGLFKRF